MENAFVYLPYRAYRFFAPFEAILSIISFLLVGLCTQDCTFPGLLFFCILGIGSLYLAKYFYDMARVAFIFLEAGLLIIGNNGSRYTWIPRHACSYGYRVLYRGHQYLLLTSTELSCEAAKKVTRRNMRRLREKDDSGVVIYLSAEENAAPIYKYLNLYETVINDTELNRRARHDTGDGTER